MGKTSICFCPKKGIKIPLSFLGPSPHPAQPASHLPSSFPQRPRRPGQAHPCSGPARQQRSPPPLLHLAHPATKAHPASSTSPWPSSRRRPSPSSRPRGLNSRTSGLFGPVARPCPEALAGVDAAPLGSRRRRNLSHPPPRRPCDALHATHYVRTPRLIAVHAEP